MGLTVRPAVDVGVAVAVAGGGIVLSSQSPCSTIGLPEQYFITVFLQLLHPEFLVEVSQLTKKINLVFYFDKAKEVLSLE